MSKIENVKACLMDEDAVNRAITRISHEIIEKNKGAEELAVIGIQRRGVPLARIDDRGLLFSPADARQK